MVCIDATHRFVFLCRSFILVFVHVILHPVFIKNKNKTLQLFFWNNCNFALILLKYAKSYMVCRIGSKCYKISGNMHTLSSVAMLRQKEIQVGYFSWWKRYKYAASLVSVTKLGQIWIWCQELNNVIYAKDYLTHETASIRDLGSILLWFTVLVWFALSKCVISKSRSSILVGGYFQVYDFWTQHQKV